MTAPTIVFLGTHGQHNIGDELLLETFLRRFGTEPRYIVNTYDPAFTAAHLGDRYRVELVDTARDRFTLLRHIRRADVVVFGGGSILKELGQTVGRHRYATLLMILAIVVFARWIARTPVAMLNIGVGPLPSRGGQMLAAAAMRQASLVTVRDAGSAALCARIGASHVRTSTDAVFSAGVGELVGGPPPAREGSDAVLRVALNLNYHVERPEYWESFQDELARALRTLAARRPIEVHALPMQSEGKEHHDAAVIEAFAQRIPGVPVVAHRPRTTSDAAAIIRGCDTVVSERFHALVMAAILGVPVFALAYDVKVSELARTLELDECWVDITRPLPHGLLSDRLNAHVDHLAQAGCELSAPTLVQAERARHDFDTARSWIAAHAS